MESEVCMVPHGEQGVYCTLWKCDVNGVDERSRKHRYQQPYQGGGETIAVNQTLPPPEPTGVRAVPCARTRPPTHSFPSIAHSLPLPLSFPRAQGPFGFSHTYRSTAAAAPLRFSLSTYASLYHATDTLS